MPEKNRLSDLDRRSLRILAKSSKTAPSGDRLSERLERAARTGSRADYEKAEETFDSLSPEERLRIGHKAEKQAETDRALLLSRSRGNQAGSRISPTASAVSTAPIMPGKSDRDAPLDWTPIFAVAKAPSTEPSTGQPSAAGANPAEIPPAETHAGRPADLSRADRPIAGRRPANASQPADPRQASDDASPTEAPLEDETVTWNWRDLPDDPVLHGGRGKNGGPADPIAELRREMLGLEAKYGKG